MEQTKRDLLTAAGIDVDEMLGRFLNNEALAMKFLLRFPGDENFPRLRQAMAEGDAAAAFEAAHTLKGVAGNLSMRELYRLVSCLVETLRAGQLEKAAETLPALEQAYEQTLASLARLG